MLTDCQDTQLLISLFFVLFGKAIDLTPAGFHAAIREREKS